MPISVNVAIINVSTNKNSSFIIQVRTGSQRLPHKMILPFYKGLTIPELIISRLEQNFPEVSIIVATTTNVADDVLVSILKKYKVHIFRGSEHDVLDRFIEAGDHYGVEEFIRICADNPFLDMKLMKELLEQDMSGIDYCSYKINDKPAMKTAYGFFAEASKISVLKKVKSKTNDVLYLEHVTNFIYENPHQFKLNWLAVDSIISNHAYIRLTVDTPSDFETASEVYKNVSDSNRDLMYKDVIDYVNANDLAQKMIALNNQNIK